MSLDGVFNNLITIKMENNSDSNHRLSLSAIEKCIITIRGQQVLLDRNLADMYQVDVGYMNRQVKRNLKRFPADFMFQLLTEV